MVSSPLKKLSKEIKLKILDFKKRAEKEGAKLEERVQSLDSFKQLSKSSKGSKGSKGSSSSTKALYYEFFYKVRRMIVSYSEELRKRDESKRQKILDRLNNLSKGGKVSSSRLIKNTGIRRYLKTIRGDVEIDEDKILQDSLWDGLYGVCSNRKDKAKQILESYRCLWKIEELFRINKHTLKMRPIYHRLTKRIKAHVLICFLAYAVLRQTEIKLKKAGLSFSPQELIDILKNVETFILKDIIKKPAVSYCIPRALSKPAQEIYSVFNKEFPKKPYKIEKQDFKKGKKSVFN